MLQFLIDVLVFILVFTAAVVTAASLFALGIALWEVFQSNLQTYREGQNPQPQRPNQHHRDIAVNLPTNRYPQRNLAMHQGMVGTLGGAPTHRSPLSVTGFPACCSGKIIHGFGESHVAASGNQPVTFEDIRRFVQLQIESQRSTGNAFICAVTNNEQTTVNRVLAHEGFRCSGFMSKTKHPDTQVAIWWRPLFD